MFLWCLGLCFCLAGCLGGSAQSIDDTEMVNTTAARGADAFNPWRQKKLPTTRHLSNDGKQIVQSMGGHAQSIQGEAQHRPHWREEMYPILFGGPNSAHEVLVVLDFAKPDSERVWHEVVQASRSLSPQQVKIVVFGMNTEQYGKDLTGFMIWIARTRKGQAMDYLTYALTRWNEVKAQQRSQGRVKVFKNEFDSTAKPSDYPIHYNYLGKLRPSVPEAEELQVARYSYDAGNINLYQATQVCSYYGISSVPAVLVDGDVLKSVSSQNILGALQ
ncbi:MAG: hypothetical protein IJU79_04980 [Desulfovibrionaceae bacterium]|nr:hypothetical protein [Desulfovibrionaceae bacterium]